MVPEKELRASDRERDEVVTQLADHLAEGRLELAEFEERSTRASAARTRGELAELTEDLPSARPVPAPATQSQPVSLSKDETPARRTRTAAALRPLGRWLSVSLVCVTIWAVSSIVSHTVQPFWPGWVIGPWGVLMLLRVLKGADGRPD
ncbi:MAG TPA: DUF1707 domain-containing protein [Streptomyces sp.]|jgi:hypothetical protein|nr:DUF1707 domain-containing protein [Streptomyces sp.]